MSESSSSRLPSLPWQREASVSREFWVIEDPRVVVAAVYEVGRFERSWVFYYLVNGLWVHIVEFGRLGAPVEGILPHFARILGYVYDVDPSNGCFLVVERGANRWWWLFYIHLRFGGYFLLFAFQSDDGTMVREERALDMDDDSEEPSVFGRVPIIYDI
jgi:hypothetical protein